MVNISLKEIAKFDDNAQDISLKDLETSFDNLIKKEKDINKFVSKTLVPKLEKNLEQYNFNSENIQTEILEKLKNEKFSDISENENTIKIYQLCQILQNKNANITIDGILWESIVNDLVNNRLQFYQEGWLWLLDWESISYESNKLLINTWFWDVEVSYDSNKDTLFEILETKENLVKFINKEKEDLFDDYINKNIDNKSSIVEVGINFFAEDGLIIVNFLDKTISYHISDFKNPNEILLHLSGQKIEVEKCEQERNHINSILDKDKLTDEEIKLVNDWVKQIPKEYKSMLKETQDKMEAKIAKISSEVNKLIARNEDGNVNYYSKEDIKLIQLWANVCFGENITIDGNRGSLFYSSENNKNQKLTNFYIYRQELITRQGVIDARKDFKMQEFNDLLNIPKLQELLETLKDVDKQNKVFSKFLDFFLEIRVSGTYFENQIGSETILPVLNYMINAEKCKNVSVEEYFGLIEQNHEETIKLKKVVKDWWYKTMYEYYEAKAKEFETISIDQLKDPKTIEEFKRAWYKNVGEFYKDIQSAFSQEPQKSMDVDDYFKEQEDMFNNMLEMQNSIKYSTMGEYFENASLSLMSTIADANKINKITDQIEHLEQRLEKMEPVKWIYQETEEASGLSYLDSRGVSREVWNIISSERGSSLWSEWWQTRVKLLEQKLKIYEITRDEDYLLWDIYLDMKNFFSEKDIKMIFELKKSKKNNELSNKWFTGDIEDSSEEVLSKNSLTSIITDDLDKFPKEFWWLGKSISEYGVSYADYTTKINNAEKIIEEDIKKRDSTNDIISQFESEDEFYLTRDVKREEYAKLFPHDAEANKNSRKWTIHDYTWTKSVYHRNFNDRHKAVPGELYKLHVPWGWYIIVRITSEAHYAVNSLISKKQVWQKLIIPKHNYEYGKMNSITFNYYKVDRSESKKNLLTVKDFCIAHKNKNGDIVLSDSKGNVVEIISDADQKSAKNTIQKAYAYMNTYEMKEIDSSFDLFEKDFREMNKLFQKFQKATKLDEDGNVKKNANWEIEAYKGISETDVEELRNLSTQFIKTKLDKYEASVGKRKKSLELLKSLQASWSLDNQLDTHIRSQIKTLTDMINFFGSGNARKIFEMMASARSNEKWRQVARIWIQDNLIQFIFAIAGAVAAIVRAAPSWGASVWAYIKWMTLYTAAVWAAGGMVGARIGQLTNEWIQNIFFAKTVNGYTIKYDNPTDVELLFRGEENWWISVRDFFVGLTTEFIMWTITTALFIKVWKIIGSYLTSAIKINAANLRPSALVGKQISKLKNWFNRIGGSINKLSPSNKVIANNSIKSFGKAFKLEFGEELFEESFENIMESIDPILWGIATVINCLSGPNPGKIFQQHNVAWWLTTIEGNKIVQGMTYNSDNISELEEYFTKEQKYTKIKSDGRKIRFKKTMNQNDVMTRKDGTKVNEHVIELVYSNASTFLNNSAEFFAKFGMTINHDSKNNEVIVHSKAQLEAFTLAVGLGWLGEVTINPDGSAKFVNGKDVVNIKPSKSKTFALWGIETYFEWKVSTLWFSETQALQNSQKMDKVLSEITTDNQTKVLKELKQNIEEQWNKLLEDWKVTWELDLSEAQLLSILDAHEQDGVLGQLNQPQLRRKVKTLSETITDPDVRRFLLEAGFSGKEVFDLNKIYKDLTTPYMSIYEGLKFRWINLDTHLMEAFLDKIKKSENIPQIIEAYSDFSEGCVKEILEISESSFFSHDVQEEINNIIKIRFMPIIESAINLMSEWKGKQKMEHLLQQIQEFTKKLFTPIHELADRFIKENANIIWNKEKTFHLILTKIDPTVGYYLPQYNLLNSINTAIKQYWVEVLEKYFIQYKDSSFSLENIQNILENPLKASEVWEKKKIEKQVPLESSWEMAFDYEGFPIYTKTETNEDCIIFNKNTGMLNINTWWKKTKELILTGSIIGSESIPPNMRWKERVIHSDIDIDVLAQSIVRKGWFTEAFGSSDKVAVDEITGFNWEPLYIVTYNGNHRTAAAKQAGLSHIIAEVTKKPEWKQEVIAHTPWIVWIREERIQKWYINGKIIKGNWTTYLELESWVFDGCHLSSFELKKYASFYEKYFGSIPEHTKNIIDDMLGLSNLLETETNLNRTKELENLNVIEASEKDKLNQRQPEVEWESTLEKAEALLTYLSKSKETFENIFVYLTDKIGGERKWAKFIFKDPNRIVQKADREYGWDVTKIFDAMRWVQVFDTVDQLNQAYIHLEIYCKENNIEVIKVKNRLSIPQIWDVLMNLKFPDWSIVELKFYITEQYIAQDWETIIDQQTPVYVNWEVKEWNDNFFTQKEQELVSKLWAKPHNFAEKILHLELDSKKSINNHTFYEIERCLPNWNMEQRSLEKVKAFDKFAQGIWLSPSDVELFRQKLIAIQVVNGNLAKDAYINRVTWINK